MHVQDDMDVRERPTPPEAKLDQGAADAAGFPGSGSDGS